MDNDCILQAQMSFALREIEDDYLTPFNVNGWPTSMYLSDDSELPRDWLVHGIVISGDLHVSGSYQVKPSTSSSSSSSATKFSSSATQEAPCTGGGGSCP